MTKVPVLKTNFDLYPSEEMQADDGVITPIEVAAYRDTERNNEYWDELGESDASEEFKEYAKSAKKNGLPILNKEAIIRGPSLRECPFGLPISYACKNVGNLVDQMTRLMDVPEEERPKYSKANRRVYVYSQVGEQCVYADKIVKDLDRVHCDFGDHGERLRDFPMRASPQYPRAFFGLGSSLYSYPFNSFSDISSAQDNYAGSYAVYASSGDVAIQKDSTADILENAQLNDLDNSLGEND